MVYLISFPVIRKAINPNTTETRVVVFGSPYSMGMSLGYKLSTVVKKALV